jgi:hypothetical protein
MLSEIELTWLASGLCALGMSVVAWQAWRAGESHPFVRDPLFLPLYFAGIVQWVVWGIRIEDLGLVVPSAVQLALLAPSLYRWYRIRAGEA